MTIYCMYSSWSNTLFTGWMWLYWDSLWWHESWIGRCWRRSLLI